MACKYREYLWYSMKITRQPREAIIESGQKINRYNAVQRVLAGEKTDTVAQAAGVHRSRIYAWMKSYREQGAAGLKPKPIPGRPSKTSPDLCQSLIERINDKSPRHFGLGNGLWTTATLTALIKQEFGLTLGKTAMKRLLNQLKIPDLRPFEQLKAHPSPSVQKWLKEEYPVLQQIAAQQKKQIFFFYQTHSASGGKHIIAAVSPKGVVYFMGYTQPPELAQAKKLLTLLIKNQGKEIFLVPMGEQTLILGDDIPGAEVARSPNVLRNKPGNYLLPQTPASPCPHLTDIAGWVFLLNQSLLDPRYPFGSFLSSLGYALKGTTIIFPDLRRASSPIRFMLEGPDLDFFIKLNRGVANRWHTNPFMKALNEPGKLTTLDELLSEREKRSNEHYQSLRQNGIKQMIGYCFAGPDDMLCGLFVSRFDDTKIEPEVKQFLEKIRPHLENAMALTVRLWHSAYTATALEEMTDHLDIAALVLDGNGRIIKSNSTAATMMEEKRHLVTMNTRLVFENQDHQKRYHAAVQKAIGWRQEPIGNKPVEAMQFTNAEGETLGVLVQPITPPSLFQPHSTVIAPHASVYISDPVKPAPYPQRQLIGHLFNLSIREAQLTALLTSGHTLNEAAHIMNITQATSRTYLQHIYEKIGVRRQSELVQRVMKSVAVLA